MITPKKVAFNPSADKSSYGSLDQTSSETTTDGTVDQTLPLISRLDPSNSFGSESSFPSSLSSSSPSIALIHTTNAWTSVPRNADRYDLDMVPSHVNDNVKLVVDPNLNPGEQGALYMAQESLYNSHVAPMYALTVHSDLYQRVWKEVNDAVSTPCGWYFCCHGGDGAHTGVSHDDHVHIAVAWCAVAMIFAAMLVLEFSTPARALYEIQADDDFFE